MSASVSPARFARLERLADQILAAVAAVNDARAVDPWAVAVATARLERDIDVLLTILKAGGER